MYFSGRDCQGRRIGDIIINFLDFTLTVLKSNGLKALVKYTYHNNNLKYLSKWIVRKFGALQMDQL